ncbi:alanine--tRNA ligase [Roseospira visakhapatnamensis]|uniref:Alanine--tRNA ligase n=1 Tax=Roseospira visakhapatnamensis TaxID=390880 RepID=A0A7W6RDT4_9PROT|nr:alanine--tRNA ligase [Roseospira visakhapatnamensis]MBB4266174.1 alanyl-tRNA synthetase [Roseospira visakhapatnamensis]
MQTTSQIRQTFIDFFRAEGHEHVASSPLVPLNDPTLMFTNAGMVPFKNVFTGNESRPYKRAVTSQKCVRAGGKHNDLDNVGYTARHHTFFEMLGNFSFGDYFKEEAIDFAWRLVTREYGLPAERLLVTVHSSDEDAAALWRKVAGLPDDRILRIPTSDNFWMMGETGPCGPCSEIFYDHGAHIPGGPPGSPDEDGDRFIEIWNLVFMQFEQLSKDERVDLPHPSIDTGMGLERLAAVLQGQHDNYDIDLMRTLIEAIADAAGTDPDGPHKVSHRVIADHLRSCGFLVADGVLPSNEGRGYVLRRIMRRAMRHAHQMGCADPLMHRLVPTLVREMGQTFTELDRAQALITETLKLEETRFKQMLDRGLRLLAEETASLPEGGTLPGTVAFKLYDTFGFPLDLTQDALRSQGLTLDTAGFDDAMARQRAEARKAWSGSGDAATEKVWFDLRETLGGSDFLGYATDSAEGCVQALVVDGTPVDSVAPGTDAALIANQSPFYGESGGQMGDTGVIQVAGKGLLRVRDTHKMVGDLIVHRGTVEGGPIAVGDEALFTVDAARRAALRAHHSATHLLHQALRHELGDHVTQKGSLVAPDRLRFDISHPKPLSAEQIARVEAEVNTQIRANTPVTTRLMDPEAAIQAGAMALFGEKYGDEVRVVSMGAEDRDHGRPVFSVELCGGTHVGRTGDIGLLKIVSESAVSAGVRRIEAVVGASALAWLGQRDTLLTQATDMLRVTPADLPARVQALLDERRRLEKELGDLRKKVALGGGGGGEAPASAPRTVAGVAFVGRLLADVPPKDLKGMADEIKKQIGSGIVALVSAGESKVSLVVAVTDDLKGTHDAVALVRAGAAVVGGKGGGGRPDMAQAGGPDADKAAEALAAIEAAVAG